MRAGTRPMAVRQAQQWTQAQGGPGAMGTRPVGTRPAGTRPQGPGPWGPGPWARRKGPAAPPEQGGSGSGAPPGQGTPPW